MMYIIVAELVGIITDFLDNY